MLEANLLILDYYNFYRIMVYNDESTVYIHWSKTTLLNESMATSRGRKILSKSSEFTLYILGCRLQQLVFVINRLSSTNTENHSPYEILFNRALDYSILHTFQVFMLSDHSDCTKKQVVDNFHEILLHRLLFHSPRILMSRFNLATGKIVVSHHVIFNESTFLFQAQISTFGTIRSMPQATFRLFNWLFHYLMTTTQWDQGTRKQFCNKRWLQRIIKLRQIRWIPL